MKKIYFGLMILASLTATQAFAFDNLVVNATGSSPVERYYFDIIGFNGQGIRENEEPKAYERARSAAIENAKKAFSEECKNSKNGEPSRVTAITVPAPGEPSTCRIEWESADKGTITCNARARGTCTAKESKNPAVAEGSTAPARVETVGDRSFLIDSSGVAHEIAGATSGAAH